MKRHVTLRGFSLIEVMIALAIFALVSVVLGAAYINVLNAYSRVSEATRYEDEVRFARRVVMTEADREEVEKGGDFEMSDGRQVRWEARIEPTDIADLFDVTFTCEFARTPEQEPEIVVQQFRLLRPTWSEGTERDTRRKAAADRIQQLQKMLPGGERS